ncbi:MAG: helix-turn-helix transcriptional regulator [Clostridiales bacterium]|nr:helix-turn-helix transcriptional regulator [Clostridiales bacterium]
MARIIDGKKMNLIGANVEKRRKELHMSQQQLSNKLELCAVYVCRGSISRIEDYSRTVTDIELYALSQVLKISINDLIEPIPMETKEK